MELSNKQKTFYELLSEFLNRRLNFEHCQKKKMTLIAHGFSELRALTETLLKYEGQHLYHI